MENILFYFKLEKNLDFIDEDTFELFDGETNIKDWLANDAIIEILAQFKNHPFSDWEFDTILFSCAIKCCLHQLNSYQEPNIHFFLGIYDFLLNNRLRLHFYFFFKNKTFFYTRKRNL